MKQIIVVLVMLFVSQILVAEVQDVNPAFSGPNDCEGIRRPLIGRIFSSVGSGENNRCGNIQEPEKSILRVPRERKSPFELSSDIIMCCEPGENRKLQSPQVRFK